MRLRLLAAALSLLAVAGACGTTRTHRVVTGTPGRPWNGYPSIVMDNEPAPGDFEEVAIVQAVGSGTHADMPHVLNGLQEQAASLGCNYVIRVHVDQGATISSATGVAGRSRQQPRRPGMPMIAKDNDED